MLKPSQGEETAQVEPEFKRVGFGVSTSLLPAVWYPATADIQQKNELGVGLLPSLAYPMNKP